MILLTSIVIVLVLFDTWYTYKLFDCGFVEANKAMKWLMAKVNKPYVYLLTTIFWIVLSWWCWLSMSDGYYRVGMGIVMIYHGYAILHNYFLWRRHK